jgi:hypothetical protein
MLLAGLLTGMGCKNFSYVSKDANGGVVQLKAGEEELVVESLKKEYGADIEVLEIVPVDGTGAAFNPNAPDMSMKGTGPLGSLTASSDAGKVQLHFRKKAAAGVTPPGLPPAPTEGNRGFAQAGYKGQPASQTTLPTPQDCDNGMCPTGK